jgi:bifunctional UDP-N-acetylglucosamine pyrophosphorylase/glucosamine-1-phosphate N-acetyltransferase
MNKSAVILAAGLGTRMRSALPKAAHKLAGVAMLTHLIRAAEQVFDQITIVIGPGQPELAELAKPHATVIQQDRLGTAHAALQAARFFGDGVTAIFYADNPLLTPATMRGLIARLEYGDAALVLLGTTPPEPGRYGRLLVQGDYVTRIAEYADASIAEREVTFCNAGALTAGALDMRVWLDAVQPMNAKQEYYLTDIVQIAREEGAKVAAIEAPFDECMGINSRKELAAAETALQRRLRDAAFDSGASMIAPDTVIFSADTQLAPDVTIGPYVVFGSGVVVESGVQIKAFSHLEACVVRENAIIGPYARLRPGADIGSAAHIGNFVEIKAATIATGAKVNHLSYIGDAEIGEKTNIGAGTITCNYDGREKHRTTIGKHAFIGSNSALVAPVTIGDHALVAAGSVITDDVPDDTLAIARGRQANKPRGTK